MQRLSEERDALRSENVELEELKTELPLLKAAQCGDDRREWQRKDTVVLECCL